MTTLKWDWMTMGPFEVAAWTRGRVLGGCASAGVFAKLTLVLIEKATDVAMHSSHPMVIGQLTFSEAGPASLEPFGKAREFDVEAMVRIQRFAK